jgi:hypothetical protein
MFASVNPFAIITALSIFLVGCDVGQTSKPYEFKNEEPPPVEEALPERSKPLTTTPPRPSRSIRESGQNPDKAFTEDRDNVVRGIPRHAFPSIQFPE